MIMSGLPLLLLGFTLILLFSVIPIMIELGSTYFDSEDLEKMEDDFNDFYQARVNESQAQSSAPTETSSDSAPDDIDRGTEAVQQAVKYGGPEGADAAENLVELEADFGGRALVRPDRPAAENDLKQQAGEIKEETEGWLSDKSEQIRNWGEEKIEQFKHWLEKG